MITTIAKTTKNTSTNGTKTLENKSTRRTNIKTIQQSTSLNNKNRIQSMALEIKMLDNYIKKYENSSGLESFVDWLGNKFAGLFGLNTIEDYRKKKQVLENEIKFMQAQIA